MKRTGSRWRWGIALALVASMVLGGTGLWLSRSSWLPNIVDRGQAAYDRGDWNAASALASARLKDAPTDRSALVLLARSAARARRDESARALYARLGGASAMQAEDLFLLGRVIDRTGDDETARACWVAGLRSEPKNAEILNEFVRLYLEGGQLDLAERTARVLAAQTGWQARGELRLGQIALQCDDPSVAATHLKRALDLDPTARGMPEPVGYYQKQLARAWLGAGKPTEANRQLLALLGAGADPETSWLLSRAALQAGDSAAAVSALKQSGSYREEHPTEPEASPYVGSARCQSCHQDKYKAEQNSLHSKTFQRAPALHDIPLPAQAISDPAAPAVKHTIESSGGQVRYTTENQGQTLRAIVDYVFGSGHQGLTLVGHDDAGRPRELRLSYYADGPSWDVTTGHPPTPPREEGYLGRVLSADDVNSCFACHTTAPHPARDNRGPTVADRAIGCERCHGPGENHLKAVAANFPDMAIVQPRSAKAAEVIALCGQCHNPLKRAVSSNDPFAVRFPATTLTWSRCYTKSPGTFDCRTCHDPHRDVATSSAYYDAKCLSCHTKASAGAVCPVNATEGCVSCHMPKKKISVPHSVFTDHHIRVHRSEKSE